MFSKIDNKHLFLLSLLVSRDLATFSTFSRSFSLFSFSSPNVPMCAGRKRKSARVKVSSYYIYFPYCCLSFVRNEEKKMLIGKKNETFASTHIQINFFLFLFDFFLLLLLPRTQILKLSRHLCLSSSSYFFSMSFLFKKGSKEFSSIQKDDMT